MKKIISHKGWAQSHKGFTLIELLVVVAIIGILAATILASLGGARQRARISRAQSEISSMRAAAELYYLEKGSYLKLFADPDDGPVELIRSIGQLFGRNDCDAFNDDFRCGATNESWSASIDASGIGGQRFCVDFNGFAGPGTSEEVQGVWQCQ